MINIILAYFGGLMTNFKTLEWSSYKIRLFHDKDNIRSLIGIIPYFWDDNVHYTLALRPIGKTRVQEEVWTYEWSLSDLDGIYIKGHRDNLVIKKTSLMRKLFGGYWKYGKRRAVVLGNLSPNKNYILKVKFDNGMSSSVVDTIATFSTKDRTGFYMQIFLILFSIVAALFFAMWSKGCGL